MARSVAAAYRTLTAVDLTAAAVLGAQAHSVAAERDKVAIVAARNQGAYGKYQPPPSSFHVVLLI
jgi:hypothetical protein